MKTILTNFDLILNFGFVLTYKMEVCLKRNGIVHGARTTFIAEKKALLSMMSQCLMVCFENQILAFCDNYNLLCTFFCQGTLFVTVL